VTKHKEDRKTDMLKAGCQLGYHAATREAVAAACGVTPAAVSYHFATMKQFRRALVRHAIAHGELRVIGQAIAAREPAALKVPPEVKTKALSAL
jgi:AcrR family transcriptional regulator